MSIFGASKASEELSKRQAELQSVIGGYPLQLPKAQQRGECITDYLNRYQPPTPEPKLRHVIGIEILDDKLRSELKDIAEANRNAVDAAISRAVDRIEKRFMGGMRE